ncbi:hypothetical protein QAD02_001119 [Eretmocerus hayati]|uniref:Uncharacterized protein n=1 Tax=Eretmocerus hayati TaxID=131215 RepID=A0ACC2NFB9_9HYME|nr:hypothetical protein QAD02_001119 [Eretmocerus hayati]
MRIICWRNKDCGITDYEIELSIHEYSLHQPAVDRIPDTCTPEETEIIRRLERQNEELRELEARMIRDWSLPHSPQPGRRGQELQLTQAPIIVPLIQASNSETIEETSARLYRERSDLTSRLQRLESSIAYYERVGWNRCGGGPCSDFRNDNSGKNGISLRMFTAMHGGQYQNLCNTRREVRENLEHIRQEIERLNRTPLTLSCLATPPQSPT